MNLEVGSRLAKIAFLTLLVCFLFLSVAWMARTAFLKYKDKSQRISELETGMADLKRAAHPKWRIREGTFTISTKDSPSDWPGDFRLASGTNVQKFEMFVWKEPGHIVTAWVSDWKPRSEMGKFDEFSVSEISGTKARFEVFAKAHTNEAIAMEFTVSFIVED